MIQIKSISLFAIMIRYIGSQTLWAITPRSSSFDDTEAFPTIHCPEILFNITIVCNHIADRVKGNDCSQWIQIQKTN